MMRREIVKTERITYEFDFNDITRALSLKFGLAGQGCEWSFDCGEDDNVRITVTAKIEREIAEEPKQ